MGELKKQGQQKREVGLGLGENAIMRQGENAKMR